MYELSEIIVLHVLNCDILSVQKEQLHLKKEGCSLFSLRNKRWSYIVGTYSPGNELVAKLIRMHVFPTALRINIA